MPPANASLIANDASNGTEIIANLKNALGTSHFGAFNTEVPKFKRSMLSVSRSQLNSSRPYDLTRHRFNRSQVQYSNIELPDSKEYTSIAVEAYPTNFYEMLFSASGLQSPPDGDVEIARRMQAMDGNAKALKPSLTEHASRDTIERSYADDESSLDDTVFDDNKESNFVDMMDRPAPISKEFNGKKCVDNCGSEFDSRQEFKNLKDAMLKAFCR